MKALKIAILCLCTTIGQTALSASGANECLQDPTEAHWVAPTPPEIQSLPGEVSPIPFKFGTTRYLCSGRSDVRENCLNVTQAEVDRFTNQAVNSCKASCNSTTNPDLIAFFEACAAAGGLATQSPPNCSSPPAGCLVEILEGGKLAMRCMGYTELTCTPRVTPGTSDF